MDKIHCAARCNIGLQKKTRSYYRMLCPFGLKLAEPYLVEERQCLVDFFEKENNVTKPNCIVVGAGPLLHLDITQCFVEQYIAVDPVINLILNDSLRCLVDKNPNVTMLNKYFDVLETKDIPAHTRVFIFVFNVISYIDNLVANINRLILPGDILFFSTWINSNMANTVAKKYFSHVCEMSVLSDEALEKIICRYDIDKLVQGINHVQDIQVFKNNISKQYIVKV